MFSDNSFYSIGILSSLVSLANKFGWRSSTWIWLFVYFIYHLFFVLLVHQTMSPNFFVAVTPQKVCYELWFFRSNLLLCTILEWVLIVIGPFIILKRCIYYIRVQEFRVELISVIASSIIFTFHFHVIRRKILTLLIIAISYLFVFYLKVGISHTSFPRFSCSDSSLIRISFRYLVLDHGKILLILSYKINHPLIVCWLIHSCSLGRILCS